MSRLIAPPIALLLALLGLLQAGPAPVAAQPAGQVRGQPAAQTQSQSGSQADARDRREAAAAARALSRLERDEEFGELYERMHPDARAAVPREAVVGWNEAEFAAKRTDELSVTGVELVGWTWEVTGERYARTAAVAFLQPFWVDGERSDVEGVVHLVEADGEWGWFFGNSAPFVAEQIARYAPDAEEPAGEDGEDAAASASVAGVLAAEAELRAAAFPDQLHAHVDAFWAREFRAARREYDPPTAVAGFGEPVVTRCGEADPGVTAAFYCVLDQTIYYSAGFRDSVEARVGDFGWVVVVAHEWGHHVQLQLGVEISSAPDGPGSLAPIELELQADCLAGVYTRDAEAVGWLDPGDIEEGLVLTGLAGDPIGTAGDDPFAHGTGEQRVESFLDGYEGGTEACGLDL